MLDTVNTATLIKKEIETLPESQTREVLDFIAFLKQKHERDEWKNMMAAQEKSLSNVWDNEEDEVWNSV